MKHLSLQDRNRILRELGYTESKRKPFLFYKRISVERKQEQSEIILFADMRTSYYTTLFRTELPLYYSKSDESLPNWLVNRVEKRELEKLIYERIEPTLRKDWISIESNCLEEYWKWMKDGYCRDCGSDMQNDEHLCKTCTSNRLNQIITKLPHCEVCDAKLAKGKLNTRYVDECNGIWYQYTHFTKESLVSDSISNGLQEVRLWAEHHIDYTNDIAIFVCISCHGKITARKNPQYKKWWPKDKRQHVRKFKYVPCKQCNGRARVRIDGYDETAGDTTTEIFGT